MGVALLLAAVVELTEALDDPDPAVREIAMRDLLALGDEAYPDIEAELRLESDSESAARMRYVLEELRPLRLDLLATRRGDEVAWMVRLTNVTSRTIEVARPRASHEMPRLPEVWIEVRSDKSDESMFLYDLRARARVRGSMVLESDVVSLASGDSTVIPGGQPLPNVPGRIRVRAIYVADSDDWSDWSSHPSEAYRDAVEPIVERVWRGRVVSDWVEIKPPVSPQHRPTVSPHRVRPATSPD